MFDHLEIRNFKSVEHVELSCRRVNVLIGKPNTGKSNILESLGLISYVGHGSRGGSLDSFVRCDEVSNLFHGGYLSRPIEINLYRSRSLGEELRIQERVGLILGYVNGRFKGGVGEDGLIRERGTERISTPIDLNAYAMAGGGLSLTVSQGTEALGIVPTCKFYRFAPLSTFPVKAGGFLSPPTGANLLSLLLRDLDLANEVNALFSESGLKLGLRAEENGIEVLTEYGNSRFSRPYRLTSTHLQRLVFHIAALRTNSDSLIVLEDPESNPYSSHSEDLAGSIAHDGGGNQFFLSTHSPHFLKSLLEKTPPEDIAVFMTNCYDYRTRASQVPQRDLAVLTQEADLLFNFEALVEST